jgi:hypothetical protein
MVEPRRELRFAQEPLHQIDARAMAALQNLDDGGAIQRRLVGAINSTKATFANFAAKNKFAECAANERISGGGRVYHRVVPKLKLSRRLFGGRRT